MTLKAAGSAIDTWFGAMRTKVPAKRGNVGQIEQRRFWELWEKWIDRIVCAVHERHQTCVTPDIGYSTTIVYAIALVVLTVHLVPYVVDQRGIKSIPGPWFAKFTDAWLDRVASEAKGGGDMKKAGGETAGTRPTVQVAGSVPSIGSG